MKRILSVCTFLLLLAFLLCSAYRILAWKDTTGEYLSDTEQLYATGDDLIDLVFVGSSHIYCDVNPAYLWGNAGISAFDLSISGMDKISSEYHLKELFKTQSPQVVCLDLYDLLFDRQPLESNVYRNYLSMRPSVNSVEAVLAYQPENPADYITRWPILLTRYKELKAFDFVQNQTSLFGRGFSYQFSFTPQTQDPAALATSSVTELSDQNRNWLDTIIDLCADHGSSLYTVMMPMIVDEKNQAIINGAKQYLESRGIECLDLNQHAQEIGLDYAVHFLDDQHLNTYGAQKVTAYLLQELTSRYTFADHRGDARYALWDENALYDGHQWQLNAFQQVPQDDLDGALLALASCSDVTVAVSVPADYSNPSSDWPDLLMALGATPEQIELRGQWILQGGRVLGFVAANSGETANADLNQVDTLTITADDDASVLLNGVDLLSHPGAVVLIVYDNYDAKVLTQRFYL